MNKTLQTYKELDTAFRKRQFKPLYFFYGEEPFLIDELQDALVSHALADNERDFNYNLFYGADSDAAAVLGICSAYPMMAERRVVVVRNFEQLKDNRRFASYAKNPNPSAVVLLICRGKPRLVADPYRALKRLAAWGEFRTLYEREVPRFIRGRVEDSGHRIKPRAAQLLAEYVGASLRVVVNEIDKLITYVGGARALTSEDVIRASGQTRESNVFELQRALGEGRQADAQRIAAHILGGASNKQGEALRIISMLTGYFTKLWRLQGVAGLGLAPNELAQRAGVSSFFIREYQASLRRFPRRRLEGAFSALLAADFEMKGAARREARLVMTLLIRQLLNGPR